MSYNLAFNVDENDFESMKEALIKNDVKNWKVNTSEGDSIYFLDPDNRKLEIHVGTLESRLFFISEKPYNNLVYFDD